MDKSRTNCATTPTHFKQGSLRHPNCTTGVNKALAHPAKNKGENPRRIKRENKKLIINKFLFEFISVVFFSEWKYFISYWKKNKLHLLKQIPGLDYNGNKVTKTVFNNAGDILFTLLTDSCDRRLTYFRLGLWYSIVKIFFGFIFVALWEPFFSTHHFSP